MKAKKGAYIVHDDQDSDITLIANGSEVATLFDALPLLNKKGIHARIVSVPSEGLFRDQDSSYQSEVIDHSKPIFGLTAGLPVTLEGLIRGKGKVYGMTHFGYSAPYTVLDEKFGYTPENVCKEVCAILGKQ
jgi:transketolase